ncbi:MAG: hypothetical protein MUF61_01090 [archaeon]|nr:hypothetical protein [archaeon]
MLHWTRETHIKDEAGLQEVKELSKQIEEEKEKKLQQMQNAPGEKVEQSPEPDLSEIEDEINPFRT